MADSNSTRDSHFTETYKSMITISVELFKLLVLINGGAAAGMIAAADKLLTRMAADVFRDSIIYFVLGLTFSVLAIFCSWFTQNRLHIENVHKIDFPAQRVTEFHIGFIVATVLFCFASLIAFAVGAIGAANGFGVKL